MAKKDSKTLNLFPQDSEPKSRCSACKTYKSLAQFRFSKGRRPYECASYCLKCMPQALRKYYEKHGEKRRAYITKYRKSDPERAKQSAAKGNKKRREQLRRDVEQWEREHPNHDPANKELMATHPRAKWNHWCREYHLRRRKTAIEYYSDGKNCCACCGENVYEFLSIDHIGGGGNRHRKEEKITNLYVWLIKKGFPASFQVLCYNCNCAKGFYGECPHTTQQAANLRIA